MDSTSIDTDYRPCRTEGGARQGRWIVLCDHAANYVPPMVNGGTLGLPEAEMNRHIAYDVGALGVSRALARGLDSPCVASNFSRLVIDPNRGDDDPTLVMRLYDGTIIPGNRAVTPDEVERRRALCTRPYHEAVEALAETRPGAALLSIHSFTPQLKGHPPRPWEIGVLYGPDDRLAAPLLDRLRRSEWCIGENQPYAGHLPGDCLDRHGLTHARPHVLIEIRNDLIATPQGQARWAEALLPYLQGAMDDAFGAEDISEGAPA